MSVLNFIVLLENISMVKYKEYTDFGLSRDLFYTLHDSMKMLSSSDVIVIIPEEKYSLYFYYPVSLRDRIQEIAGDKNDDSDYMLDFLCVSRNNKPKFYFKEFTIIKKNIDIAWNKGSYKYIRYEEDFSIVFKKLENEENNILSFEKWIKKLSLNDKKSIIKCILKFNRKPCV